MFIRSAIQLDVCDEDGEKIVLDSENSLKPDHNKLSNTLMVTPARSRARSVMNNKRAASRISAFSSQESLVPKTLLSHQQISQIAVPIKSKNDESMP